MVFVVMTTIWFATFFLPMGPPGHILSLVFGVLERSGLMRESVIGGVFGHSYGKNLGTIVVGKLGTLVG